MDINDINEIYKLSNPKNDEMFILATRAVNFHTKITDMIRKAGLHWKPLPKYLNCINNILKQTNTKHFEISPKPNDTTDYKYYNNFMTSNNHEVIILLSAIRFLDFDSWMDNAVIGIQEENLCEFICNPRTKKAHLIDNKQWEEVINYTYEVSNHNYEKKLLQGSISKEFIAQLQ
jgi:hypothetical protein